MFYFESISRAPGTLGCRQVELTRQRLHPKLGERDGLGAESVGFDNVRTSIEVLVMNLFDDLRLRQAKQVVIALQIAWPVFESLAPIVGFFKLVTLNHCAHRAVNDNNALA